MRLLLLVVLNSGCKDGADASEFLLGSAMSPSIGLLNALFHIEHVGRHYASLCQEKSLVSGLREIFDYPSIEDAILHLDSLDD